MTSREGGMAPHKGDVASHERGVALLQRLDRGRSLVVLQAAGYHGNGSPREHRCL